MGENEKLRTIQAKFFSVLRNKNFGEERLATQVADLTGVSQSTAYKKIRCDSPLTAREYMMLSSHFGVSLDALVLPSDTDFLVRRPNYIRSEKHIIEYLSATANELKRLSSVPHDFYYSARDLPVFLFFTSEPLIRFKIAVWLSELSEGKDFSHYYGIISRDLLTACKSFYNGYKALNRTEIWSQNTMDNLAHQIKYYNEIGQLKDREVNELNTEIIKLLDFVMLNMKQSEEDGKPWEIYEADFLMMASNGLVLTPKKSVAYISYAGINYLRVEQNEFCKDLESSFIKQKANATSLVASRKSRVLFFNQLKQRFQDT